MLLRFLKAFGGALAGGFAVSLFVGPTEPYRLVILALAVAGGTLMIGRREDLAS